MSLSIRPATDDDFALYVRLVPELGVDDPPAVLEKWQATQRDDTLIAERAGEPLGLVWWQRLDGSGYVRQLITAPAARRLGVGRALMQDVAWRLSAAGCKTWRLNVKPHNTAAIALYRALGFHREYGSASFKVDWPLLERLPAGPTARILDAAEDLALEQALGLPPGQVSNDRRLGRVLLTVGPPYPGFASFNPDYPGSFPFRARSPEVARALLEAMRAHSRPGATYAGVVVENDDALAATLKAAGALLRMEFDNYAGTLL
jgi:ribosomal protein S18 acetylase RimI-like enzyme